MVERHGPWPSNEQLAWTPRQRQVLELIMTTTYDGDGPITVDLVCDTGTVRIINQAGRDGDANGSLIVDIPPEATHCSFDVRTDGWWSIRST